MSYKKASVDYIVQILHSHMQCSELKYTWQ